MKNTPAPYCQRCQFYHGANQVVCGLHPYGPDNETCSDYVQKFGGQNQSQTSRHSWSIRHFHEWKVWQKVIMLGLLLGTFGSGCVLVWFATTHSTAPITNTSDKSSYNR